MQKKLILLGVLVLIGIGLHFLRNKPSVSESVTSTESSLPEISDGSVAPMPLATTGPTLQSPTEIAKESPQVVPGKTPLEQFNQVTHCLDVDAQTFDLDDMHPEKFVTKIQQTFGGVTMKSEDWSRRRIRMKSGEERSIRIELDENDEGKVVKRLTYYGSANESPESALPISKEQTDNPSETLIASLVSDGELLTTEKSYTLYFNNGPQAKYLERNGVVVGFEFDLNGHSFQCDNLDRQGQCTCR